MSSNCALACTSVVMQDMWKALNRGEVGPYSKLCIPLQDCQCSGGRQVLGILSTSISCLMLQQAAQSCQSGAQAWAGQTDD